MWLVLDTNQTALIPTTLRPGRLTGRAAGLTIPPFVMAEILPRGHGKRRDTLSRLLSHQIRIGVEPSVVWESLCALDANQIPLYQPFPAPGDPLDFMYGLLLKQNQPVLDPAAASWAKRVTDNHQRFISEMARRSQRLRQRVGKDLGTLDTFDETLGLADGPDSFMGSMALKIVTEGRSMKVADGARLYRALMKNPYIRHFLLALLFYIVSVSHLWTDTTLHRGLHKNDWTDLLVSLYVGKGDTVVTADRLLHSVFAIIDPSVRIVDAPAL